MRTANTSSNTGYFDVKVESERGTKEFYQEVKKQGFKFMYIWINSDESWRWFATNEARANEGAAELYAKENGSDMKTSRKYHYEYIDVIDIDTILEEWF